MPDFRLQGAMAKALAKALSKKVDRVQEIPEEAFEVSQREFPDQAWNFTPKNAFRHAMLTGRLTQEVGAPLAKLIGYAIEAKNFLPGQGEDLDLGKMIVDMKQDLNANAFGAEMAKKTPGQEELIRALLEAAKESKVVPAPGIFSSGVPYLIHSKER